MWTYLFLAAHAPLMKILRCGFWLITRPALLQWRSVRRRTLFLFLYKRGSVVQVRERYQFHVQRIKNQAYCMIPLDQMFMASAYTCYEPSFMIFNDAVSAADAIQR